MKSIIAAFVALLVRESADASDDTKYICNGIVTALVVAPLVK